MRALSEQDLLCVMAHWGGRGGLLLRTWRAPEKANPGVGSDPSVLATICQPGLGFKNILEG